MSPKPSAICPKNRIISVAWVVAAPLVLPDRTRIGLETFSSNFTASGSFVNFQAVMCVSRSRRLSKSFNFRSLAMFCKAEKVSKHRYVCLFLLMMSKRLSVWTYFEDSVSHLLFRFPSLACDIVWGRHHATFESTPEIKRKTSWRMNYI